MLTSVNQHLGYPGIIALPIVAFNGPIYWCCLDELWPSSDSANYLHLISCKLQEKTQISNKSENPITVSQICFRPCCWLLGACQRSKEPWSWGLHGPGGISGLWQSYVCRICCACEQTPRVPRLIIPRGKFKAEVLGAWLLGTGCWALVDVSCG